VPVHVAASRSDALPGISREIRPVIEAFRLAVETWPTTGTHAD
jgi:hypothetical protein